MANLTDEEYELEKKNVTRYHNLLEIPLIIFFFVGIITSALNITINEITPLLWFILSFWCILIIICMETTMIRAALERKK